MKLSDNPLLKGDLTTGRIPKESHVVRLFVSSTFTDMSVERNMLMKETFPRLMAHFRELGFEFQVVDMRWGVREEAVLDHKASTLCNQEIQRCKDVSRGVAFLALLGDRYGSVPILPELSMEEFETLTNALKKNDTELTLLKEWYKLDENSVPPVYVLLARSELLLLSQQQAAAAAAKPDNVHHVDFDRKIQDGVEWRQNLNRIQTALQLGAELAVKAGKMTKAEAHRYFTAVTESEITAGILTDPKASKRAVCVFRRLRNIDLRSPMAGRFIDFVPGKCGVVDANAQRLLNEMKCTRIRTALRPENMADFDIEWAGAAEDYGGDGVAEGVNERKHAKYLKELDQTVFQKLVQVSERRIAETSLGGAFATEFLKGPESSEGDSPRRRKEWFLDVCQHLAFAHSKVTQFIGRGKILVACQRALIKYNFPKFTATIPGQSAGDGKLNAGGAGGQVVPCNKPIVIHGPSGYGKTSVMAKVFTEFGSGRRKDSDCQTWLSPEKSGHLVKIIRFLGTSPLSCSIYEVIKSLITHIQIVFGLPVTIEASNFAELCDQFNQMLWNLADFDGLVFIALDALDQLSPEYGAMMMHWLPTATPSNVHMFLSLITDTQDLMNHLRRVHPEPKCYIPMTELKVNNADKILEVYGNNVNRKLTPHQKSMIIEPGVRLPMYIKLAFDMAKNWKSFLSPSSLGRSVNELISQLFDRLESEHGLTVVRALQHITASKEGLTDQEIEDLLSLDDEVLQDVYIYHLPPESSVIRLPSMLWRRIRQEIDQYLVEKEADATTVVNWYHRAFWEAARNRLVGTVETHVQQAEYFSGKWANRSKPLSLNKGKTADYPRCLRNAPEMPWDFGDGRPNLRKLSQLAFNTIFTYEAGASASLLLSFDYLHCKLRYQGLKSLLADFRLFFTRFTPGQSQDKLADLVYLKLPEEFEEVSGGTTQGQAKVNSMSPDCLQVKIVYDMLSMATDILSRDWRELAANAIGRLDGLENCFHPPIYESSNEFYTVHFLVK